MIRGVLLTDALSVSMFEVLVLYGLDELVADMVVDPDAAHAQRQYTQGVLVIVGQRALADCADKNQK